MSFMMCSRLIHLTFLSLTFAPMYFARLLASIAKVAELVTGTRCCFDPVFVLLSVIRKIANCHHSDSSPSSDGNVGKSALFNRIVKNASRSYTTAGRHARSVSVEANARAYTRGHGASAPARREIHASYRRVNRSRSHEAANVIFSSVNVRKALCAGGKWPRLR